MKQLYFTLTVALLIYGCSGNPPERVNLNSVSWMQSSEEYRALMQGAYNTARQSLDDALEDKTWTAFPSQMPANNEEARTLGKLPLAVILDIDETVLSTLPYQAWLIKNEKSFSRTSWHTWVSEARADATPGALEFVRYAMEKGVKVFYLSNRAARGALDRNRNGQIDPGEEQVDLKPFTVSNLLGLGFLPQKNISNEDAVLLRGETDRQGRVKKGWASRDKTARRESLSPDYRVVLIMGDNLNDIVSEENHDALDSNRARWGRSWIVLPNPAYGHWEKRLYNSGQPLSDEEKINMKLDSLDIWQ